MLSSPFPDAPLLTVNTADPKPLAVIVLAAGKGTRMNNPSMAKVMYDVCGKPMVQYVVELATRLDAARTMVIVGWQKDSVIGHLSAIDPRIEFIEQAQQLGTGHAVQQTMEPLNDFVGDVLILSGDVPLLTEKTARALIGFHRASEAAGTILTADVDDPSQYGRIVRSKEGNVRKIVEEKDASKKEREIREINSGIYVFDKAKLFECLPKVSSRNAQGEYYLTDVFDLFWKNGWRVSAVKAVDSVEVMGINDPRQLEQARGTMRARLEPTGPGGHV
jgi:UDP-N-acetylglucosamine diphosphorylase/glucosamine-1-phosphate N-acetyltransferase